MEALYIAFSLFRNSEIDAIQTRFILPKRGLPIACVARLP
jgi:hypothetical protein